MPDRPLETKLAFCPYQNANRFNGLIGPARYPVEVYAWITLPAIRLISGAPLCSGGGAIISA